MTRRLFSDHAQPLDTVGTITRTQAKRSLKMTYLSITQLKIGKIALVALVALVSIALAISTAGQSYADSPEAINSYKLYAHSRIYDFTQFICFTELINRESRWQATATNGNHFGLAQGIYKTLWRMDAYRQIDWSITYIKRRYKSECRALAHSSKYGWY